MSKKKNSIYYYYVTNTDDASLSAMEYFPVDSPAFVPAVENFVNFSSTTIPNRVDMVDRLALPYGMMKKKKKNYYYYHYNLSFFRSFFPVLFCF